MVRHGGGTTYRSMQITAGKTYYWQVGIDESGFGAWTLQDLDPDEAQHLLAKYKESFLR